MLSSEKPAENAPSDSTSPNITRELAVGSGWMIGAQLAIQAIGLLSTIILARLLIPADFGLVAVAITIFAGLQALSDLSFDVPLIQNPHAGRAEYDSAWTLSACRDILIAIGLTVAAEPIASGFEDFSMEFRISALWTFARS
jgi:lipopolysaccharide exporter